MGPLQDIMNICGIVLYTLFLFATWPYYFCIEHYKKWSLKRLHRRTMTIGTNEYLTRALFCKEEGHCLSGGDYPIQYYTPYFYKRTGPIIKKGTNRCLFCREMI